MTRSSERGGVCLLLDWTVEAATLLAVLGYVIVYAWHFSWPPIRSDGFSYYVYLPATFIHHDPTLQRTAVDCCGGEFPFFTGIFRGRQTGRWANPHPIGEAILLLPFYVVAEAATWWSNLPRDGFSLYYQLVVPFAGPLYFGAGLAFLKKLLLRYFSPGVVIVTLLSIIWGTNLFHYATYDSIYSHVYSFFLCSALLYLTTLWFQRPSMETAILLGAVCALSVLVRHTNALLLLFPLLYGLDSKASIRRRVVVASDHVGQITAGVIVFAALLGPQLWLYHVASGRWLASPYEANGTFTFGSPHLFGVLLSVRKGLFFWSPLLLFSVAELAFLRRWAPTLLPPTIVVLPVLAYILASWSDWQMGGSYGHRGFTDLMPVFAVALASFYAEVNGTRWRTPLIGIVVVLLTLSVIQMVQYWLGIIPFANSTWSSYQAHFLQLRQ